MFNYDKKTLKTLPLVDIDFMNTTHLEEIVLVKKLGKLVTKYQQNGTFSENEMDQITLALEIWFEHTHNHFEEENKMMEETAFPAIVPHSNEHTNALARMNTVINIWKESQDIQHLQNYVFNIWPTWFTEHVNSMDLVTAQHAEMANYKEEYISIQK